MYIYYWLSKVFNMSNHSTNIINSAIATTIAELITLPICTIKTNYQNSNSKSIITSIKTLYKNGGVLIFYKASVPAISSQVFTISSKYFLYRWLNEKNYYYSNKIINGMISGILVSVFTHPMDVIKIHWQMTKPISTSFRTEGFGLLYRGYSKTIWKASVGSALYFPLYDYANEYFQKPLYAALFSAVISTIIIQPIDYLKTRHIYGQQLYQGLNPMIYYKGLTLNLMRVVPHFIIIMTTISYLDKIKLL